MNRVAEQCTIPDHALPHQIVLRGKVAKERPRRHPGGARDVFDRRVFEPSLGKKIDGRIPDGAPDEILFTGVQGDNVRRVRAAMSAIIR